MSLRFDRRTLSKAKPSDVIRLAKYAGINVSNECVCYKCIGKLIEDLVRKLDVEEGWPPKLIERKW